MVQYKWMISHFSKKVITICSEKFNAMHVISPKPWIIWLFSPQKKKTIQKTLMNKAYIKPLFDDSEHYITHHSEIEQRQLKKI